MSAPSEALVGIVDDDPSVRKGLARLVKTAGYRVEVFASAREFLARPPQEDPCCLLLDVRMPGLTGLELQEALAIAGRRMSIVFVSGHGEVVGTVKAMKRGAIDFLTKPVDARELLAAIERAVAKAFTVQRAQADATDMQGRLKTRRSKCTGLASWRRCGRARWPSWSGWLIGQASSRSPDRLPPGSTPSPILWDQGPLASHARRP